MNARDDELVTLDMPARIWAGIDAEVDNAISSAAEDGDEATVEVGQRIRQAGWDQVPWVNGAWPPMDQVISIRLTVAEWMFAADEARRSVPIYEGLGDDESARCQRSGRSPVLWACELRSGGQGFSGWVVGGSPGGCLVQGDHSFAGEGFGEAVAVALGGDEVGVV